MEPVLNYDPAEQRYLALRPALEVVSQQVFQAAQVAVETGEGVAPAMKVFSTWLKRQSEAVVRMFVTAPESAGLEREGLRLQPGALVGAKDGQGARLTLHVTPQAALQEAESPSDLLYSADVPLRVLTPDVAVLEELLQLSRQFSTRGGLVGMSLADSMVFASKVQISFSIPAHMIGVYRAEETV